MGCEMQKPVTEPVPAKQKAPPSPRRRHHEPTVDNEFINITVPEVKSPVAADEDSLLFESEHQPQIKASVTKPITLSRRGSDILKSIVPSSPKEYKHTFKAKMEAVDSLRQISQILCHQLETNPIYNVILSKEYVIQMAEEYEKSFMSHSQTNSLNSLLLSYLTRSVSQVNLPTSTQQLNEFSVGLGREWHELRNSIQSSSKAMLQIIDFLCRKKEGEVKMYEQCLLDLKLDLNNDEVRIVCDTVLRMMRLNWKAVYFFTVYLELSALHLERNNVSLIQINQRVKKAVALAGALSGVPYKREEEGQIIKKHPNYKNREYQKEFVELQGLDNKNKMFILNDFIKAKAEETVAAYAQLNNFVEPVCSKHGSNFQGSTYQGGTLDMVKARQKFMDAAVEQIDLQQKLDNYPQFSIANQVRSELINYEKQLSDIIGLLDQNVEVKVSHFVVFTCWFATFDKINECADELKKVIQTQQATLLEVENKLKSVMGVSELIFKIMMKEVRFEVHLVFDYNLTRLIFREKVDFVGAEKAFSCLTAAQLVNKTLAKGYFSDLYQSIVGSLDLKERNSTKQTPISFEVAERQLSEFAALLPFELDLQPPGEEQQQFFWEQKKRFLKALSEIKEDENVNVNQFPYQKRCRNGQFKEIMGETLAGLTEYEKCCEDYRVLKEERGKRSARSLNKSSVVIQMSMGLLGQSSVSKQGLSKVYGKPLESYSFAFSLLRAGRLHFGKGSYDKAIESYLECVEVCEKKSSSGMRKIMAEAETSIGLCEFKKGYYRKAIDTFQKCFKALPQHLPKEDNFRLTLQKHISQVLREQGVNHQALRYNDKCLHIVRKEWGEGSMPMVELMDFNVDMYEVMGDMEAALEEEDGILDIITKRIGKNTINYAQHLRRKGQLFVKTEQMQASIDMYQRSIKIKENLYGSKTVHSVEDILLAAESQKMLQRYDHAIEGLRTCASIYEVDRARKCNELIKIYTSLGENHEADMNYPEALQFYQLSLTTHEKFKDKQGADYVVLLENVSRVLTRLRNTAEVAKYNKIVERLKAKQQSAGPIDQFQNLSKIAQKAQERGNYPLSLKYLARCLQMLQAKKGKGTLEENELLKKMGRIYRVQGETNKAIQLLAQCLEIIRQNKGDDNFQYAEIYAQLGQAFEQVQEYSLARENYESALDLCEKYKIKYHTFAYCSHGLANTYFLQERYTEALKYYEQAAPIFQKMKVDQYATVVQRISSCREAIKERIEGGGPVGRNREEEVDEDEVQVEV